MLDPNDPEVQAAAEAEGIPRDWVLAAQRSPIWALIQRFEVALPLHPEYRTLPMVWYIPPLSPVVDKLTETGHDGESAGNLFGAIDSLRIPISYLAALFTAGDPKPVRDVLARLAAMRSFMRDVNLGREPDISIADAVGMTPEDIEDMHRLLAIAKYDERYVIPSAHSETGDPRQLAHQLEETATECSLDYEGGPGMGGSGPFGESSGGTAPIAVENFHMLKQRQTSDTMVDPGEPVRRVNLLNWDGKGSGHELFPPRSEPAGADEPRADEPRADPPAGSAPESPAQDQP
jgi:nitrate reductase beta subunit